jgi:hypothetical protein
MTVEYLMGIVGVVLALLPKIPYIGKEFDKLSKDGKRLLMAGLLTLVALVLVLFACVDIFGIDVGVYLGSVVACTEASIRELIGAWFQALLLALGINQGTHWIADKVIGRRSR